MASLELQNETYRIVFLHEGRKRSYSLKTGNEKDAERMKGSVEDILFRITQGYVAVPADTDIVAFLKNGGKAPPVRDAHREQLTLQQLQDRYVETHSNGALEANTLQTVRIHVGHMIETLGARFVAAGLTQPDLQKHIDRRSRAKGLRGKKLSPATLRKEITSLRAVWNWARKAKLVPGQYPNDGLVFPKADEKPSFATYQEIETRIARGGLSKNDVRQLWDCLFLTLPEVAELLRHVKEHARPRWLYPMVCMAAHTGARRSELLRISVHDIDLTGGTALLHEKKRDKQKRTTRRVPLSPFLVDVLKAWLAEHPGGPTLFCQPTEVERSKTHRRALSPVTRDEAHDHFQRVLADSKWDKLRGWHVLRHSFASNCAAKAVDQRLIDEWMGHQTEEMRKRYRHLMPSTRQQRFEQSLDSCAIAAEPPHMDASNLIRETQRAIARSQHIFPELYSTCDYISQEDRICHQRTMAMLAHAAWMLPESPAVELENRFVVGYEEPSAAGGKRKAITWHPDMLLRDCDKRILLFVDFESPNSSDARVLHRNLTHWYPNYVMQYEATPPYLIITSLPNCHTPGWLFRYAHADGWNWEHAGKGDDVQQNPFRYWYGIYRKSRPSWQQYPITFANFNGNQLAVVDFDNLDQS